MPEKEELAVSMVAYVIFPWQVERVLHVKFPDEISRAEEAGFVSGILFVCIARQSVCTIAQRNCMFELILYILAGLLGQTGRNCSS